MDGIIKLVNGYEGIVLQERSGKWALALYRHDLELCRVQLSAEPSERQASEWATMMMIAHSAGWSGGVKKAKGLLWKEVGTLMDRLAEA